jgi:hypothetical protein
VDEQRCIHLAAAQGLVGAFKRRHRHDHRFELGQEQTQHEVGGSAQAGDPNSTVSKCLERHRARRDQDRAITRPDAAAVRQQQIAIGNIRVLVNRHRGHVRRVLRLGAAV